MQRDAHAVVEGDVPRPHPHRHRPPPAIHLITAVERAAREGGGAVGVVGGVVAGGEEEGRAAHVLDLAPAVAAR